MEERTYYTIFAVVITCLVLYFAVVVDRDCYRDQYGTCYNLLD